MVRDSVRDEYDKRPGVMHMHTYYTGLELCEPRLHQQHINRMPQLLQDPPGNSKFKILLASS